MKLNRLFVLLVLGLIFCFKFAAVADNTANSTGEFWDSPPIRVLVWSGSGNIKVETDVPYVIKTADKILDINKENALEIKYISTNSIAVSDGSLIEEVEELQIHPATPSGISRINGKRFRGEITIYPTNKGSLQVINTVSLEQYLYGVVAREMGGGLEAMKAQALVARTFAVSKMKSRQKAKYDLDATSLSQVYEGLDGERRQASLAVDDTRGEVLGFQGKVVSDPLYHSTCGGHTANNEEAFLGTPIPYLRGVEDVEQTSGSENCKSSPLFQWQFRWDRQMMGDILKKFNIKGEFEKVEIVKTSPSNRVEELKVATTEGEFFVKGEKIRRFFQVVDAKGNRSILPSTRFTLTSGEGEFIEVLGGGAGHGVGMCQWGAMELARRGEEYPAIVRKYYQGTDILQEYGGVLKYLLK